MEWIDDYCTQYPTQTMVLLIDIVSSLGSVGLNWQAVKGEGLPQELFWIGNNVVFGILTFVTLSKSPSFDPASSTVRSLMAYAFLNCAVSFVISWFGYFRAKRDASKRMDHNLVAPT